jgi:CheY-like chemotaxis protein
MKPCPVLYAEDDDNDAFLMQRAFGKNAIRHPLHIVPDGTEAIRFLSDAIQRAGRHEGPLPGLILLDLNLPRITGLEVLKWIREQPELRAVCVLVFTSSSQDRDIQTAYALGANGYLVKPVSSEKLLEMIASVRDCCLGQPVDRGRVWLEVKGNVPPPTAAQPA